MPATHKSSNRMPVLSKNNVDTAIRRLECYFGGRLTEKEAIRVTHGYSDSLPVVYPPDAVIYVQSEEEVATIVKVCDELQVPLIPFGAGSSLEAQTSAIRGGIAVNMSQMNRIVEVKPDDFDCCVQPGVTRNELNSFIRDKGLFFPLDPGHDATLGGMAATRASGTNAVRYGTMRDVTLGLTVVTPNGSVVRTGCRARKSSAGYDLTRLYIGSEGTLGIITELKLRLFGIPEGVASGVAQFPDLPSAISAVIMTLQVGVPVARIELLDELQMKACIDWSHLDELRPRPTLFFEFHGSNASIQDQIFQVRDIFSSFEADEFRWATHAEDRSRLWKARHDAYHAARSLSPGKNFITTDACVPLSHLADCILQARAEAYASGLACPIVGHVGDGNFHMLIPFDPGDALETAHAEQLSISVARHAIACGGTCTGEHGVGLKNLNVVAEEIGPAAEIMRTIKSALDPKNIMNPGKTVPGM